MVFFYPFLEYTLRKFNGKGIDRNLSSIQKYGFWDNEYAICDEGTMTARVVAVHRERYELICNKGFVYGRLKSSVYYNSVSETYPTVGDFVLIKYVETGDSIITKTLERRTVFLRKDPASKLHRSAESDICQAVAANFDYVFIVTSLNNDFSIGRVERYLTTAYQSGAVPVIILTKSDLIDDYSDMLSSLKEIAGNTKVHVISSKTGYGVDTLSNYFEPGKTMVFLGSSGVGKSSLINRLAGEEIMSTGSIREDDSKGRHTTTYRQLIMLDSGAMVIDTPGMRELGMWDASEGVKESFADVTKYFGQCKFRNCKHESEPGCTIKKAIEDGELTLKRWSDYNKIVSETEVVIDKKSRMLRDKEFGQRIGKMKRQQQKLLKARK